MNKQWKVIWCAVIWSIWIHRNECVFRNHDPDVDEMIDGVLLRAWLWLKGKSKEFNASFFGLAESTPIMLVQGGLRTKKE